MSFVFDGVDQYLEDDVAAVLYGDYSFSFWFKPSSFAANSNVLFVGDKAVTSNRTFVVVTPAAQGKLVVQSGGTSDAESTDTLTINAWNHIVATHDDGGNLTIRINGGSAITVASGSTGSGTWDRTSIGRAGDSTPGNYTAGKVEQVGIWDSVLSSGDQLSLADGSTKPSAVSSGTLVSYIPLETDITDAKGLLTLVNFNGATQDNDSPITSGPSITSITDPAITGTALTLAGVFPETITGVTQSIAGNSVALDIVSQTGIEIVVTSATIESTQLRYGVQTIEITDSLSDTDSITYTANPLAGNSFTDATSIATVGQIITAAPLAIGDQVVYENVTTPGSYDVTVLSDMSFIIDGSEDTGAPDGVYDFEVGAWDLTDQTWGTAAAQTVTAGTPASVVVPIITLPILRGLTSSLT